MELHPDEKAAYEALFVRADSDKDGAVGVADARSFYSQFGLAGPVLGQIWGEANQSKREALSKDEFFVSLRLVALAQAGKKVDHADAVQHTGAALVPRLVQAGAAATPASPAKPAADWVVSAQQAASFDQVFQATDTDRDGFITGLQARELFLSYNIPVADLKVIWELSDINKDEKLSRTEFLVAMYLILRRKQGDALPAGLPATLVPSIEALAAQTPQLGPMSAEELDWFRKVFAEADTDNDGYLSGDDARDVFLKSGLDVATLRRVWEMADVSRGERLSAPEFALAMYLISWAIKGHALPDTVPPAVLQSAGVPVPAAAVPVAAAPLKSPRSAPGPGAPTLPASAAVPVPVPTTPTTMRPASAGPAPASGGGGGGGASSLLGALKEATAEANALRQRAAQSDAQLAQERTASAGLAAQLGEARVALEETRVKADLAVQESARLAALLGQAGAQREALDEQLALLRGWTEAVQSRNTAAQQQLQRDTAQLEALRQDVQDARRGLEQLQALSAAQDAQAAEVQRGLAEAQAELRQLRGATQETATHMAQQGAAIVAASNPFADLVDAPATGNVAAPSFGSSFDFGGK